jgi:hypothetical protein
LSLPRGAMGEGPRARPWETARRVLQAAAVDAYGRPALLNLRPLCYCSSFMAVSGISLRSRNAPMSFESASSAVLPIV